MIHRATRTLGRTFAALLFLILATTTLASAGIQVNKQFAPASVPLGGQSVVTVTLQNSSTTSPATISAFSDDVGTTMAGHAQLLSPQTPTTTCPGGTPTIAGGVISMANGQIPVAPLPSTPGTCTITFTVVGTAIGNGFNTILAANVVTNLGSPSADVTQTLSVQSATVGAAAVAPGSVQIGDTSTVTYTITNPTGAPLTNVAFPLVANAAASFTLTGSSTTCGGTATLPAPGTAGTANFSGLTVPANGTCTVTLTVTTPTATTVNFTLPAGGITDNQLATNAVAPAAQARFVNGSPNVTKAFNPAAVVPGGTTTLTINVQNVLTDKPLTNAAFNDVLPANLTLVSAAIFSGNCGAPTITGLGTGTIAFTGGTIATNKTCTITATVSIPAAQPPGSLTNTIPANSFTSTEVNGAAGPAVANLLVTGPGGGISTTKTANPNAVGVNTPVKITLNFASLAGGAFTNGTFTDNLPQVPVAMVALTDAAHTPTFANCGAPAIAFANANTVVTGSNLAIASGATCVVSFFVTFPNPTGATRIDVNALLAANVSFTGSSGAVSPGASPTVNISELPTLSATNYLANNSGLTNQPLTVSGSINDPAGIADTGAVAVFTLNPGRVQLSATPNFTFTGCPAGLSAANIAIAPGRETFTVTIGNINATCTIGYDVIDEGGALGTFTPGNSTYSSALTGGVPIASGGTNNVTFATTTINVGKSFAPNQVQAGGISTADIALTVPQAGALAKTQANGVVFNDALPANMNFAPTPNVNFGPGCQQAGQPAPSFTIAGTTISFTNISLITNGAAQTKCDVTFDVTSSAVGAPLNQIAAGAITSTSGITNTQTAKASLTVNAGLGIQKTFVNATLPIGGTNFVRFLITNSATPSALVGGTLIDVMPASLVLASTTEGPTQAGDPALCGGTVAGTVGTNFYQLNGITVAGSTGALTPGQCVVYVQVTTAPNATPGPVTNTIASGALNIGGFSNQTPASGSTTLAPPPGPTVTKAFLPTAVAPSAISLLTITIANAAPGAAALSGINLVDLMPPGLTINAAATNCASGTVSLVPGNIGVTLSGASLAANATCTISASVVGAAPGSFTNTIPATTLTSTQGATNAAPATATLSVVSSIALNKAFAPATIPLGGTSTLTITIPNTAPGAVALSGVSLNDTLPLGLTIAATPNAATTCGAATVTAIAGSTSVGIANGSVAANTTCTLTVSVTNVIGAVAGPYLNTIPANALTTTEGVTNGAPATATLTLAPSLALTKAFAPGTIPAGGVSRLTVTLANTAAGAIALTGVAVNDTFPAGVTVAAVPNFATTCPGGPLSVVAGTNFRAANLVIAANTTCTVSVDVTGAVAGSYTNTIPAGTVTSTEGVSNAAAASANLVIGSGIALSKSFAPAAIFAGGNATLTILIPNTSAGSVALTNVTLTDTLPAGVTIAATPNATTSCGAGTVTAIAGATSVALANGSLAANATCSIKVTVTSALAGSYTNTIPANALSTTQGFTNSAPASANLAVASATSLSKSFTPNAIPVGGISTLTITIPNTGPGAVALSGMTLNDALPAGITVATNAATTCGGGSLSTPGGTSVNLTFGTVAANATCTITIDVTGTTPGTFVNTIPANALTTVEGATNTTAATASLAIVAGLAVNKTFAPATIPSGGSSTLTITIPNTGPGAIALAGLTLRDALPAGITIAAVPNAATTCGAGTVTAAAGGASVALANGSVAVGATCTITVNVTGTLAGTYTNTIPTGAITTTQGISNTAPATANVSIAAGITLVKTFSPTTIPAGGVSVLTIGIPNTGAPAIALSGIALTDALPAGMTIASTPATTCGAGIATAAPGGTTVALTNGSVAANATCIVTVSVTGSVAGTYTNTIPTGALSTTQGVTNPAPVTARLAIAPGVTLSKAFAPNAISVGGISTLTISILNTGTGAIALTNVTLSDALPAGVTIAAVPNASTTCGTGTVTATAAGTSVALANGSVGANATCTIAVNVTGSVAGTYTNTIPANALTTLQGVTNAAPAQAVLTLTTMNLTVVKTSTPGGANVSPGQTIGYTIAVTNNGSVPETNAKLTDTLTNARLVPGSVKVNGVAVADTIITTGVPFGTVPAGATVTIAYSAIVNASATAGTQVANSATVNGDVPCTGTGCTSASRPNIVEPPILNVTKSIDGGQRATVVPGQTVTYTMTVSNTGNGPAQNVNLTDPVPNGVTPIAGSVTLAGVPAVGATVNGQVVTVPVGAIAPGSSAIVTFRATVNANVTGQQTNVVSIGATGIAATVRSNPVVAMVTSPTLAVTKTASATVVSVGDRVDYAITVNATAGIAYGATTVVDTLPAYMLYAPGTARVNGKPLEPTVSGTTLTWHLPNLVANVTITYATAIASGVPQNQRLTNTVDVTAFVAGTALPGRGHASASVQTVGTTFGACYPITGRAYLDVRGSGRFEDGDVGIPGLAVFLDDGESVVTDAFGRYNFPCVRPGMHALRLDETTLPDGVLPYDDRNIDSEKSLRRLVHRTFDATIIEDINFALTGKPVHPLAPPSEKAGPDAQR